MPKPKRKKQAAVYSDMGTEERRQHGPLVVEAVPSDLADTKNRDRVRAIEINDPLWQYRRNRTISVRQRDAGLSLRALWEKSGIEPRVVGGYEEMIAAGSVASLRLVSIDHYQRYQRALRTITSPLALSAVVDAVCFQERLRRNRVQYLKKGLDRLAHHFGA